MDIINTGEDMWIKNTEGKKDAMLTFAVIAFAVVILNVFLATFGTITIFGVAFGFSAMTAGTITALLGPTLTAYVGRRFTGAAYPDSKLPSPVTPSGQDGVTSPSKKAPEAPADFDPSGER
jgi:uncharacterized membrane protein